MFAQYLNHFTSYLFYLLSMIFFFMIMVDIVPAQEILDGEFRALRQNEVNIRVGPGLEFPIKFVYNKIDLPVSLLKSYNNWYYVRDHDNDEGWVHRSMLSQKKTAIIITARATLRRKATDNAPAVAYGEKNVTVTVNECDQEWCLVMLYDRLRDQDYKGWVKTKHLWGAHSELKTAN